MACLGSVGSALIALVLSTSATLADPVGTYEMSGTNPGTGSKHSGTVVVQRTGDTFHVTVTTSGERRFGGIGDWYWKKHWETISVSPPVSDRGRVYRNPHQPRNRRPNASRSTGFRLARVPILEP
jgi:hypothetical protein